MNKLRDNVEIRVYKKPAMIEVVEKKQGESDAVWQRITFEDSHDFCKFILEMARDVGVPKVEFAVACNDVVDEIEGWDNL